MILMIIWTFALTLYQQGGSHIRMETNAESWSTCQSAREVTLARLQAKENTVWLSDTTGYSLTPCRPLGPVRHYGPGE